jgi:hypothetical protein
MASKIDQETDARFWAQTGYKPGQKLDPKDPTDAKMVSVWKDIFAKVKREADAGKLITTFDHPVVVQNLADAHVADQAAAVHLDAAAAAPDPKTAQQNIVAATTASEVVAQKTREAASLQPPTVSPQLAQEASQEAKQEPPHPSAPAKDHIANAQAQAVHKPSPRGIIDKETNARFWAQTHYKPGQKLDSKNPTDASMMPVWKDIYAKVKREDDAGNLILTYNHPVVATNLADAHVADQAAAMHLDAAAVAPDPQTAQQNVAAAAAAVQVAAQKTREAATLQPPTVSPQLAHEAAHKAPPPGTSPRSLHAETDARFWAQTHYKPGQRLNPRDPKDAAMIPVWMGIYAKVAQEAAMHKPDARDHLGHEQAKRAGHKAAGVHHDARHRSPTRSATSPHKVKDHRERATRLAHEAKAEYVLVIELPDGTMDHKTFATRAELDAEYTRLSEHHDQYKYLAAFALGANPNAPVVDSVGIPAAEHADVPAPVSDVPPAPSMEMAPPTPAPEEKPSEGAPEEKSAWSIGKIVAIAAAVAAAGGLVYAATRKPSRASSSSPRTRTSKVIVATPMRTTPSRALLKA